MNYLWKVVASFRFLHAPGITWFWINRSAIQSVWTPGNNRIHVCRVAKRNETKTTRATFVFWGKNTSITKPLITTYSSIINYQTNNVIRFFLVGWFFLPVSAFFITTQSMTSPNLEKYCNSDSWAVSQLQNKTWVYKTSVMKWYFWENITMQTACLVEYIP